MTTLAVAGSAFTELPGSSGMPVEVYATDRDMLYAFSASQPAWTARSTASVLKACVRDIVSVPSGQSMWVLSSSDGFVTLEYEILGASGANIDKGAWDASAGTFPGGGAAKAGWRYRVSVAGTVGGQAFDIGDVVEAIADNASTTTYAANWQIRQGIVSSAEVVAALGYTPAAQPVDGTYTPTVTFDTVNAWAPTYTLQNGVYRTSGLYVDVWVDLAFAANDFSASAPSGNMRISLPFTPHAALANWPGSVAASSNLDLGSTTRSLAVVAVGGAAYARLRQLLDDGTTSNTNQTAVAASESGYTLTFHVKYKMA